MEFLYGYISHTRFHLVDMAVHGFLKMTAGRRTAAAARDARRGRFLKTLPGILPVHRTSVHKIHLSKIQILVYTMKAVIKCERYA